MGDLLNNPFQTLNRPAGRSRKENDKEKLHGVDSEQAVVAKDGVEELISISTVEREILLSPEAEAEGDVVVEYPTYSYRDYAPAATVVYTRHEEEADDLIGSLKPGPVAFDMEWRVIFTRAGARAAMNERRTAVVQIADTSGLVLVVQITGMARFPKKLQELIEDSKVPKVGVNILNDGHKLFKDYGILSRNLVELGALAQVADPEMSFGRKRKVVSLAKLVEGYCGKTLEKGDVRTGNWEKELDEIQLEYAANDVHSSIQVYNTLLKKAKENEKDIETQKALDFYTQGVQEPGKVVFSGVNMLQVQEATEMRSQYMRAYRMWHQQHMSMEKMCVELSLKGKGYGPMNAKEGGLKVGTVISYIISALQADPVLPYETEKVRELLLMDLGSWMRHREWFVKACRNANVE
ncbi:ribonuclease H-like domain-containing protein [Cyathus striatus]|nr:ribonuclease H-like domain-containing protein [Cyathus striatus]